MIASSICTFWPIINAWRMRTMVTVLCLSVCYQSPGFFSRLYDKLDIPVCSSLDFLGFQLTEFDKTVSFEKLSAFHNYFVVSSPYEWLRILLVAVTVTWSVVSRPQYHFCQLNKFDRYNGAAALAQATAVNSLAMVKLQCR